MEDNCKPMPPPSCSQATCVMSHAQTYAEYGPPGEDDTGAHKRCNCKKAKCLKLYCICFSAGVYCGGCACRDCQNTMQFQDTVWFERQRILQRSPRAFAPKVEQKVSGDVTHKKGCRCRKSRCLKKYCECFDAGVHCSTMCRCDDCHNQPENGSAGAAGAMPVSHLRSHPSVSIPLPMTLPPLGDSLYSAASALVGNGQMGSRPGSRMGSGRSQWGNGHGGPSRGSSEPGTPTQACVGNGQAVVVEEAPVHHINAETPDRLLGMGDFKHTTSLAGEAPYSGNLANMLNMPMATNSLGLPSSLAPSPLCPPWSATCAGMDLADVSNAHLVHENGGVIGGHVPEDELTHAHEDHVNQAGTAMPQYQVPVPEPSQTGGSLPARHSNGRARGSGGGAAGNTMGVTAGEVVQQCQGTIGNGSKANGGMHHATSNGNGNGACSSREPSPFQLVQTSIGTVMPTLPPTGPIVFTSSLLQPDVLLSDPEAAQQLAACLGLDMTHQVAAYKSAQILSSMLQMARDNPTVQAELAAASNGVLAPSKTAANGGALAAARTLSGASAPVQHTESNGLGQDRPGAQSQGIGEPVVARGGSASGQGDHQQQGIQGAGPAHEKSTEPDTGKGGDGVANETITNGHANGNGHVHGNGMHHHHLKLHGADAVGPGRLLAGTAMAGPLHTASSGAAAGSATGGAAKAAGMVAATAASSSAILLQAMTARPPPTTPGHHQKVQSLGPGKTVLSGAGNGKAVRLGSGSFRFTGTPMTANLPDMNGSGDGHSSDIAGSGPQSGAAAGVVYSGKRPGGALFAGSLPEDITGRRIPHLPSLGPSCSQGGNEPSGSAHVAGSVITTNSGRATKRARVHDANNDTFTMEASSGMAQRSDDSGAIGLSGSVHGSPLSRVTNSSRPRRATAGRRYQEAMGAILGARSELECMHSANEMEAMQALFEMGSRPATSVQDGPIQGIDSAEKASRGGGSCGGAVSLQAAWDVEGRGKVASACAALSTSQGGAGMAPAMGRVCEAAGQVA